MCTLLTHLVRSCTQCLTDGINRQTASARNVKNERNRLCTIMRIIITLDYTAKHKSKGSCSYFKRKIHLSETFFCVEDRYKIIMKIAPVSLFSSSYFSSHNISVTNTIAFSHNVYEIISEYFQESLDKKKGKKITKERKR
jgi:hypothetical protein